MTPRPITATHARERIAQLRRLDPVAEARVLDTVCMHNPELVTAECDRLLDNWAWLRSGGNGG